MVYAGFIVRYTYADCGGLIRWAGSFQTIQEVNDAIKALKEAGATNIEYFRLVKDLLS